MRAELPSNNWEVRLLAWALEARENRSGGDHRPTHAGILPEAYLHCERITRTHSRTFYLASGLLPEGKREAVRALYAFCRVTDNIVDTGNAATREAELADWAARVSMTHPPADDLVAVAWANARARYHIPAGYARQLIDGVARDLVQSRYATFCELAEYAYGVASTVGLMAMHIIGFQGEEALPYAVKLGVALQVTNVLRDVGEDWRAGRLYLPADELAEFGLTESDVAAGRVDDRWRRFMKFQIARNRQLYAESMPGIALLNRDGRFAIAAAASLYEAILTQIERNDYDVFNRRASVSTLGKMRRLPGIWRRARRGA
jgi:phytoene synthase